MKATLLLAAALIGIGFWGHDVGGVRTKPSKPAASATYDTSLIHFKPTPEKKATKTTRAKGFDF
jgi:hypothetical protein